MTTTTEEKELDSVWPAFNGYELVYLFSVGPNPWQPRQNFNQLELIKLAEDIRLNGLINPVTVRQNPAYGPGSAAPVYQIAAGERRWRAYKLLLAGYELSGPATEDGEGDMVPGEETPGAEGEYPTGVTLKRGPDPRFVKIPVIIKQLDDVGMMRVALGENEKRNDLTAMEEAEAFAKMIDRLGVTQTEFGKRMGLSQSFVANRLRMLRLPESLRHNWITGQLTQWHAIKLLEWQGKFNLTMPYLAFLTIRLKKNQITTSYLDDGLFEDKIVMLPGGRELLQNNPLPVQASMLDAIEEEVMARAAVQASIVTYPVPAAVPIPTVAVPTFTQALVEEAEAEIEEEEEEPVTPIMAPTHVVPAPAPAPVAVDEAPATLASAAQAQPNINQARKDAAAKKFAENYSNKYLPGQSAAPLDTPTCRMLARLLVINSYLRMVNPAAFVVRMQKWLRAHNLTDDLAPVQAFPLPVVWIDQQLEAFGSEFYRRPEVIQLAVAMTTECALATGDFNNPIFQGELYYYIRAALNEAAKKAENEIPEFK